MSTVLPAGVDGTSTNETSNTGKFEGNILELYVVMRNTGLRVFAMTHKSGKLNLKGVALEMYKMRPHEFDVLPDKLEVIEEYKRLTDLQKQYVARCHTTGKSRSLTLEGFCMESLFVHGFQ